MIYNIFLGEQYKPAIKNQQLNFINIKKKNQSEINGGIVHIWDIHGKDYCYDIELTRA